MYGYILIFLSVMTIWALVGTAKSAKWDQSPEGKAYWADQQQRADDKVYLRWEDLYRTYGYLYQLPPTAREKILMAHVHEMQRVRYYGSPEEDVIKAAMKEYPYLDPANSRGCVEMWEIPNYLQHLEYLRKLDEYGNRR